MSVRADIVDTPGRGVVGVSEDLSYRLWLMAELTGNSVGREGGIAALAAQLTHVGCPTPATMVREHVVGASVPAASVRAAYGRACGWWDDDQLLGETPQVYLVSLIQAELLWCTARVGRVPLSRGSDSPHGMHVMSVAQLRLFRAELLASGRLTA